MMILTQTRPRDSSESESRAMEPGLAWLQAGTCHSCWHSDSQSPPYRRHTTGVTP